MKSTHGSPMEWKERLLQPGVLAALGAALLFGAGTPAREVVVADCRSVAAGRAAVSRLRTRPHALSSAGSRACGTTGEIRRSWWLAGAIAAGGVVGPVLLMLGLTRTPASGASLLLNAEGVFTALLAWFAFKENFDWRIALGMAVHPGGRRDLELAGGGPTSRRLWPALAILGACLAWAIDNNLTRRVSLTDATWLASIKGLAAGAVNLTLAIGLGARGARSHSTRRAAAMSRRPARLRSQSGPVCSWRCAILGTARTGAYFSGGDRSSVQCLR